jgi:hypothetical protein
MWFLVITFFAALGIYKNLSGDTRLSSAFSLRRVSELNEMLIGLSAVLFVWLNARRFSRVWSDASSDGSGSTEGPQSPSIW